MNCARTTTLHFRAGETKPGTESGAPRLNGHVTEAMMEPFEAPPQEYTRPDIVILGSMRSASEAIKRELVTIGDEKDYHGALMVLRSQSLRIQKLTDELLRRFVARGIE